MTHNSGQTGEPAAESWIVPRPPQILMELPFAYRWEVTRRHPYYLRFWEFAHRFHQQPSNDPTRRGLEETAALILRGIGVSGDPTSPATSAEGLGAGNLSQAWEGGAVAQTTFRALLGILLLELPPELRGQVGQLFLASQQAEGDPQQQKHDLVSALCRLKHPALDAFPNRPLVGINLHAPQRVITEAVESFVRKWKEETGIPERRRRDDKLDEYLAVWDRREGWVGDHYDVAREQTLREIAKERTLAVSTTANQYRSAFYLIFGQDYTPELWSRVLGCLKICEFVDPQQMPKRTLLRPWRSPQPRLVPESALQPAGMEENRRGILNTVAISQAEIGSLELQLDIQELIALGRSNKEISELLEMTSETASDLIDYLRARRQDLPS
jgi:hypothetical protein